MDTAHPHSRTHTRAKSKGRAEQAGSCKESHRVGLQTASEATNSGSWISQVSHQDPAWHTFSLTTSLSQFHLTNVWSRGIFQNMNSAISLLKIPQPLGEEPGSRREPPSLPHMWQCCSCLSIFAHAVPSTGKTLPHMCNWPAVLMGRFQLKYLGLHQPPRPSRSCHPVLLSPMHTNHRTCMRRTLGFHQQKSQAFTNGITGLQTS